MHGTEEGWMGASATMDTPVHRKTFAVIPVNSDCSDGGWVLLREGDSSNYIKMINPNRTSAYSNDAWVIRLGTTDQSIALNDTAYHFLIENEGYVVNRESMACINVIAETDYPTRGHSNGWNRNIPAGREFGASIHFQTINDSIVQASIRREASEQKSSEEEDAIYLQQISRFPRSMEKRVISFGLYGSKAKYTVGAIRNAQLAKEYFPGWICRFYVTSDVPKEVLANLTALGSELVKIPDGKGYISGMFYRFLVASDPTVDRYIIRDTDSRLNARDRIAVEEWINSRYPVHIMRDHVNHCIVMNGGMWGGVKGAIKDFEGKLQLWENKNEYMADLHFLDKMVWPDIQDKQISHDAYCCDRYPNAKPFPTKRYMTYQHVGQVFNELDEPRLSDIDGFIRGVPIPSTCRKHSDWIYG